MESIVWTVDWNPEFEHEARLKREVLKALGEIRTIQTIKRFAEQSQREALDDHLETEHIIWLDSSYEHAFFVRVWYEMTDEKLFILIEENDLGDVGMLAIEKLDCASYSEENVLKVELKDLDDLGIPP